MPVPIYLRLVMSRVNFGEPLGQETPHYGLFDEAGMQLSSAVSDTFGRIIFQDVQMSTPGLHLLTVREIFTPPWWETDTRIWPVHIDVVHLTEEAKLVATVIYPEGVPVFESVGTCNKCGSIVFPELTFTEPGIYEYTIREQTSSGEGWITDDKVVRVLIIVEDDGHGNLVAFIEYLDGFPTFTNTYILTPVRVVIAGCKFAIGAPLPPGRFTFGLYAEDGTLVHTTTNGPADEKTDPDDGDADSDGDDDDM